MGGANPYFDWKERFEVTALRREAEQLLNGGRK